MTFVLSKLLWALVRPGNLLVLLLWLGWLIARRRRRAGHGHGAESSALVGFGLLAFTAIAVLPLASWLAMPLEKPYPPPALPAHVDGIIVLGGAVQPDKSADRGQPALNDVAERMTAFATLARLYPQARLVFTGGSAALLPGQPTEAVVARQLFTGLGIAPDRMVYEDQSRNTFENAVFTKRVMQPKAGETWLLVTSAWHMPRALGCFLRVGWSVVPWPVDYRSRTRWWDGFGFDLAHHLLYFDEAVHEWLGLIAYRVLGRVDSLLPPAPVAGAGPAG